MPKIVLDRPQVRLAVIRLLAEGVMNQTQIAARYDVSQQAVSFFSKKYFQRIEEVRDKLDDDFAGIWIAQKAARLEVYQQNVEDLQSIIDAMEKEPAIVKAQIATLFRAQQAAVRSVAEELGDLPTRSQVQIQSEPVTYRIEGVDLDDVK